MKGKDWMRGMMTVMVALILSLTMVLAGCGSDAGKPADEAAEDQATEQAAEPEATDEEAEEVEYFSSWSEDAPAIIALKEYVEDVTNPDSPNYIKPEERIVVSDLDGTLYG